MNTLNDQFRSQGNANGLAYVARADGNVGWQAKRLIVKAWKALLLLDSHSTEQWLAELRLMERAAPMRRHMLAQHEALLAAGLALAHDDIDVAAMLAGQVSRGAQTEEMARVTSVVLRFVAWRIKNWKHFDVATCLCPCSLVDKRQAIPTILTLLVEAAAEMKRSRLVVAKRLASDALRFATKLQAGKPFAVANAAALMAELLYEQGELDEAEKLLRRHLPQISRCGCPDAIDTAYATLARVALNRGQWKIAGLLLQELVVIGKMRAWPRLEALGHAHEVELQCGLGDMECARTAMRNLQQLQEDVTSDLSKAEIGQTAREAELTLRALAEPSRELVHELRACIDQFAAQPDELRALRMRLLSVEVLTRLGEDEQAESEMQACLKSGMRCGAFQSFLRGSAILREKMTSVYNSKVLSLSDHAELRAYLASLIGREREHTPAKDGGIGAASKNAITAREREILLRMGQGYSNKKIAKDLGIGPETVKSHAKRIFFKLGVATRIEAVSCANDLRLL
jgi:ATP/maltotriose-dependent transcriptional regulator MalT